MTTTTAPGSLTTGWEPGLDPGDTVLRRYVLHYAECVASAATALGGRVVRRPDVWVADHDRPAALLNSAVLLQPPPTPHGWERLLDDVDDLTATPGAGDVFLWSAWPTPDLAPRGWELEGHPPLLVRAPGGTVPAPADDLRVVEVRDAAGLEDWAEVVVEGFPFDELRPYRPGSLVDARLLTDPRWRFWVAYHGARPVAVGTQFVSHGFAQLALGVTLPEARGRGTWYALVRERLLAEPRLLSGGVFSDDSRPGAERLGYLPVSRFTLWRRRRP